MTDRFKFLEIPSEPKRDKRKRSSYSEKSLIEKYFEKAIENYFSGNFVEALRTLSRISQEKQNLIDVWVLKILTLLCLQNKRQAIKLYSNVLTIFKNFNIYIESIGLLLTLRENRDIKYFLKRLSDIQKKEDNPILHIIRFYFLVSYSKISSKKLYKKLQELKLSQIDYFFLFAILHLIIQEKKYHHALSITDILINEFEENYYLFYLKGLLNYKVYADKKALKFIEICLNLNPKFQKARDLRAKIKNSYFPGLLKIILSRIFPFITR